MLTEEEKIKLIEIHLTEKEKILFRKICYYSIDGENLNKLILKQWFDDWYLDELELFTKKCAKYCHVKKKCTIFDFPIIKVFHYLIFRLLSYE